MVEDNIKIDLYRHNYERIQEIQKNKKEAMLRKIGEDQQRIKQIEEFRQNTIIQKQHMRHQYQNQRHHIDIEYSEKKKKFLKSIKADKMINLTFDAGQPSNIA